MDTRPDPDGLTARVRSVAFAGRRGRSTRSELAVTFGALGVMLATATLHTSEAAVPGPWLLVATVAAWIPLLARTYWPVPVLAAVVAIEAVHLSLLTSINSNAFIGELMGAYQPVPLATMLAAYTVASRTSWRTAWIAGGSAAGTLVAIALIAQPTSLMGTNLVMCNVVLMATGAGVLVTSRREYNERAERDQQDRTRQAVLDERLRIARDLHDVLAHNLALVNAQASVSAYLLRTDPAAASAALQDISRHTHQAMDELRATVGLLRTEDTPDSDGSLRPPPGLVLLDDLVASVRSTGVTVDVRIDGEPQALDDARDVAVYRITQEALTNATKHAPNSPVEITFGWTPQQLHLHIVNRMLAADADRAPAPGTGNGLIGMHERATAVGGTLTAAVAPTGDYEVHATIPVEPSPEGAN